MRTQTFLWNTAYRQAMAELSSEENVDRMSWFFADVNTVYIFGRLDTVQWDDALFHDWVSQQTFWAFIYRVFTTMALKIIRNAHLYIKQGKNIGGQKD